LPLADTDTCARARRCIAARRMAAPIANHASTAAQARATNAATLLAVLTRG
jgi:hypothetical protein